MMRLILLAAALALPTPFLFSPAEGTHAQRDQEAADGSDMRRIDVRLDLPASTAWVSAPFTAIGDVVVWGWTSEPGQAPGARHHAGVVLTSIAGREDGLGFGGGGGVGSHAFELNAGGPRAVCCETALLSQPSQTGQGDFDARLSDGETLWVSFIGANVDDGQPFDLTLVYDGGELAPGVAREGVDVELFDLVDEAHANGVNARFGGRTLAGFDGATSHAFAPSRNGFASLHYWPDGEPMSVRAAVDGTTLLEGPAAAGGGLLFALGASTFEVDLALGDGLVTGLPAQGVRWRVASLLVADLDVEGFGVRNHVWEE